jgi:rhodanese-related sulfurtransferase
MARISVKELNDLIAQGHAPVVVDVRSASAREIDPRRVPGSVVVDIADLDARLGDLPPDRDIILYCT